MTAQMNLPPQNLSKLNAVLGKLKTPDPTPTPVNTGNFVEFEKEKFTDGAKGELKAYPILDAYKQWFGYNELRGQGENRQVNCFNKNGHANGDRNPSMDLNISKNVYVCHGCEAKGDMIDLAANKAGLVPLGSEVPDALVHLAVKYGCESLFPHMVGNFVEVQGNWRYDPTGAYDPNQFAAFAPPKLQLVDLVPEAPEALTPDNGIDRPTIAQYDLNWRDFIPPTTPMYKYLELVTQDSNPEEFHFFNFLQIISLVLGRDVCMGDDHPLVYGNLMTCIIGATGQGKSKSLSYVRDIINNEVMRFDADDHETTGVRMVSGVGSGEILVDSLGHEIDNPIYDKQTNPGVPKKLRNRSPRSLVVWSEFSNLVAKSSAKGSTISDKVIDMYDLVSPMAAISRGYSSLAYNAYACAVTTTQLNMINKLTSSDDLDSGFLNRWIFVIGTPKPYEMFNRHIDIYPLVDQVLAMKSWVANRSGTGKGQLHRTAEATAECRKFAIEKIRPRQEDETTQAMFARADLLFKKLVLLCAANMMEKEISIQAVYQAERIWLYLEHCYMIIDNKMQESIGDPIRSWITRIVQERAGETDSDGRPIHITPGRLKAWVRQNTKASDEAVERTYVQMIKEGAIELMDIRQDKTMGRAKMRVVPNE